MRWKRLIVWKWREEHGSYPPSLSVLRDLMNQRLKDQKVDGKWPVMTRREAPVYVYLVEYADLRATVREIPSDMPLAWNRDPFWPESGMRAVIFVHGPVTWLNPHEWEEQTQVVQKWIAQEKAKEDS